MHSTLKPREIDDPHDAPAIAPDVVPVAWADKVLADIRRDASSRHSDQPPPAVDTTFRATATDDIKVELPPTGGWARKAFMAMFALCCALAAAAWQHYGDTAIQMISYWTPPFALTSSPPTETTGLAGQPNSPTVAASTADQAAAQPAALDQPAESVAPAAAAPAPESAQLQSMARDLASMGQQIEQLRASVDQLKAGQQATARDVAKTSEVRPAEPTLRPKMSALPPRPAPAPPRKPRPIYPPAQATAAPVLPQPAPLPAQPPPALQPSPPAQAAIQPDGEPVVRPPMPLR